MLLLLFLSFIPGVTEACSTKLKTYVFFCLFLIFVFCVIPNQGDVYHRQEARINHSISHNALGKVVHVSHIPSSSVVTHEKLDLTLRLTHQGRHSMSEVVL